MSLLEQINLPTFGRPSRLPELEAALYRQRLGELAARSIDARLDYLVVYADREHFANMAFLIGFDPRFE